MTNAGKVCAECGATVFADAPEGVCSVCLFRTGLASTENESEEALEPTIARMFKDFGDYELVGQIGHGGQGVVYRARQKSLNRTVALKVIGLAHWATEAHVTRFRMEAEAAARLDDPHIVPIYEIGERDGACYYSMKFVEGGQLDEIIGSEPMPGRKAAELIAKLAHSLHHAHQHGVLHRDVKPGNILLDAKGEPHLTDFGLARLVESESTITRTLEVIGTPSYMAPEELFAIQSQIAQRVAEQLKRKVRRSEKTAIARAPTADLVAFDYYIHAKTLLYSVSITAQEVSKDFLFQAVDLLNKAVARDPKFVSAYCQLAKAHGRIYAFDIDHSSARRDLAEAAVRNAERLAPDDGETQLARARFLLDCDLNFEAARKELAVAERLLPNDSELRLLAGYIARRQGRWEESLSSLEKAIQLDPRNFSLWQEIGLNYHLLRPLPRDARSRRSGRCDRSR